MPILMSQEYWMNSQFSIARFAGKISINGERYIVYGTDLILEDWLPVISKLGRERTIKLINNGTSLEVAKAMTKVKKEDLQLKLEL